MQLAIEEQASGITVNRKLQQEVTLTKSFRLQACLLASVFVLSPASAMAKNTAVNNTDATVVNTSTMDNTSAMGTTAVPTTDVTTNDMAYPQTVPDREDHGDFPWGLLGLLGLAGLLGVKRRDDDHVRVDHADRTVPIDRTDGTTNNRM